MSNEPLFAGVDEAGRGPLCGEVVAAVVVLDPNNPIPGLDDSKKLSEKKRDALFPLIQERALAWCIATASVEEIDRLNILQATMLAMQRAVNGMAAKGFDLSRLSCVLIDGDKTPNLTVPVEAIVKGDSKVQAISAASILAKVYRDRMCIDMDTQYPGYGILVHKGYPTAAHMEALARLGPTPMHRTSFGPVKKLLTPVRPARLRV